ncbi:MAG: Ku protein [Bacilli bacterium]|nr:Ku protein [Bacilli bacterium]
MPNIRSNISFALVNIPVLMNPVIRNNDTSFNQLHKKCLQRIKYIKYCPHCKKDVKEKDIVKGYEYENDNYLVLEKEELDKLKPENDKTIEIVGFVDIKEIDPVLFEKSYVLETDGKSKAYNLFCNALKKTKKVALAKTIIGSKFYYCVLRLTNFGIIMTTLYFDEEVVIDEKEIESNYKDKELNMAVQLIESLSIKFNPEEYKDEYQNNIKNAINDKLEGREVKSKKAKPKEQVNNLMAALEKSLKKYK